MENYNNLEDVSDFEEFPAEIKSSGSPRGSEHWNIDWDEDLIQVDFASQLDSEREILQRKEATQRLSNSLAGSINNTGSAVATSSFNDHVEGPTNNPGPVIAPSGLNDHVEGPTDNPVPVVATSGLNDHVGKTMNNPGSLIASSALISRRNLMQTFTTLMDKTGIIKQAIIELYQKISNLLFSFANANIDSDED